MGAFSGPKVVDDGLVFSLDGANYKSFKGQSVTNLYYVSSGASANTSIFSMPMGGTATGSYTTSHSYGSWSGNTIFKVTVSSGTLAGGYESFRRCVPASFDSTYGTTRRVSAKVKMLKGSITSLGFHNGGGTGGHNSSHYTPISESSVPTDVLSKDGWYQFDLNVSGSYPSGHCVGIGIVGSDIEFLVTEMMLYPSSSFVRFTPTTRGTTVATGGGWADLTGNGNHGALVNGVRESSDNLGALVFDGTDDYVTTTLGTYTPYCIDIWFKNDDNITSAVMQGNYQQLLGVGTYPGGITLGAWTGSATDETFSFFSAGWSANGMTYIRDTASSGIHNLVVNWNGSSFDFWLDGYKRTTYASSYGHRTLETVTGFQIGSSYNNANSYEFDGNVYSVKVYTSQLTDSQVQQNFNATRSRFGI